MGRGHKPPGLEKQARDLQRMQREMKLAELNRLAEDASSLTLQAGIQGKTAERVGHIHVEGLATQFKDQAVIWQEAADHAQAELARQADAWRAHEEMIADRQAAYRVTHPAGQFLEDVAARTNDINRQIEEARARHQATQDARYNR
jgi:hypothetical protein